VLKKKFMTVFFTLLFFGAPACQANIYFWTDAEGKKHFSDTPQLGANQYKKSQNTYFYPVKFIFDGDTVQLKDGRKIRLVGINTPEVAHRNNPAQEGGEAAKQWLTQQLQGKKVRLEFAQQKQDKYKRYLAHLFTEEGLHINLELVRLGFASVSIFPPNLAYVDVLTKASNTAETKKIGIWQYQSYAEKTVQQLNLQNKYGWQRIVGRVQEIQNTRKSVYLVMSKTFKIRIKKKYLYLFKEIDQLKGKKIEVRGWVNKSKKQLIMQIKHPSVMKNLN
jgi:endonuclease YncB( thermonuclease family)